MEVRKKTSALRVTEPADSAPRLQRPITEITVSATKPAELSPDVQVELTSRADDGAGRRAATNEVIGVINLAATVTEEIDGLVRHVAGLTAQVSGDTTPDHHRAILEQEAQETVAALRERSFTPPKAPVGGSLDDTVRAELERTLGRTLDFLLPERLSTALDLGKVDFSTKEAILRTQTTVEVARQRIEQIKSGLDKSRDVVQRALASEEIAVENRRAAGSSVRDLDQAADLAGAAWSSIRGDPREAIGSIGLLGERALSTLQ